MVTRLKEGGGRHARNTSSDTSQSASVIFVDIADPVLSRLFMERTYLHAGIFKPSHKSIPPHGIASALAYFRDWMPIRIQ